MAPIFENLTPRQQAYKEVCERHEITIGDLRNSGGEDSALYFADDLGNDPEMPVERYCAVTRSDSEEFHYAYPDYDSVEGAQEKAVSEIGDSIFPESPVEVVDLDTGEIYKPHINVTWTKVPVA